MYTLFISTLSLDTRTDKQLHSSIIMNRISQLIFRRITGVITPDELAELERWESLSPENREFAQKVADHDELEKWFYRQRAISPDRVERNVNRHIAASNTVVYRRWAVAAVAAVILFMVGFVLWKRPEVSTPLPEIAQSTIVSIEDIQHGTQKAILSTPDGRKINLTDTAAPAVPVIKADVARLDRVPVSDRNFEQLCIETPRGGEFKVVLEDSTVVWLNADSKLYYPDNFTGNERRVSVSGEAYFEVAKDASRPFYVESQGQQIRVYGTRFNVRCYDDDPVTYTTLEEGSISLSPAQSGTAEVFLTPGKQARFTPNDAEFKIHDVNTETVSSWRNGFFVFENQTLLNIMRDLSRWYNFEFELASPELADELFMGVFPRDCEFATAIKILEISGGFTASVENGKVVITAK